MVRSKKKLLEVGILCIFLILLYVGSIYKSPKQSILVKDNSIIVSDNTKVFHKSLYVTYGSKDTISDVQYFNTDDTLITLVKSENGVLSSPIYLKYSIKENRVVISSLDGVYELEGLVPIIENLIEKE